MTFLLGRDLLGRMGGKHVQVDYNEYWQNFSVRLSGSSSGSCGC